MSSGLTRDDTNLPPPGFDARAMRGDPATGMTQSAPRHRPLPNPVAADGSVTSRSLSFTFCDTGVRLPDGCASAGHRVPIHPGTDATTSTPQTSTPATRSTRHAAAVVAPVVSTSSMTTTRAPVGRRRPGQPAHPVGEIGRPRGGVQPDRVPGRSRGHQAWGDPGRVAALGGEPGRGAGHHGDRIAASGPGGGTSAGRGHQPDGLGQQAEPMQPQQPVAERPTEVRRQIATTVLLAGQDRRAHRVGVPGQCPDRREPGGTAAGRLRQPDPPGTPTQSGVASGAPGLGSAAAGTGARQHEIHRGRDAEPAGLQDRGPGHRHWPTLRVRADGRRRGGEMWTTRSACPQPHLVPAGGDQRTGREALDPDAIAGAALRSSW